MAGGEPSTLPFAIELILRGANWLSHIRGHAVLVPSRAEGEPQFANFLDWWREHKTGPESMPEQWPEWSGPMDTKARAWNELISPAEWSSLSSQEQREIEEWLQAEHAVGLFYD
jgi:hypothetical protein